MPAAAIYTPLDVAAARTAVDSGKPVRVGILPTHLFPAGGAGRVRRVGDPAADGPEFIDVEVVVAGAKDVIPFAPTDLSPIKRSESAPTPVAPVRAARPARAARAAGGPRRSEQTSPAPTPASESESASQPPPSPGSPASAAPPADAGRPARRSSPARPSSESTVPAVGRRSDGDQPAGGRRTRTRRQPISVTISTVEPDHTSWQVSVTVGAKQLVKPTSVHPAKAWALVAELDNPSVAAVVAQTLADHRSQAQERADRLARELAEAEAELARYPIL